MFAQLISPGLEAQIAPMTTCLWSGFAPVGHCRAGSVPSSYGVCYAGVEPESGRCIAGTAFTGA